MEIYSGKLTIEIATLVEKAGEKEMTNKAHEALTTELLQELRAILGAAGYMASSLGATLEKVENAKPSYSSVIASEVEKSKKEVLKVYNKANSTTIKID
ncbi:hypothetical protein [Niallia sp.]|uniref:hypothetical protein n=1 Tax=Niallia sp. TaxID=2837523 RepID=UPI00289D9254|nr:hypothetical protein [Niallia sp.]